MKRWLTVAGAVSTLGLGCFGSSDSSKEFNGNGGEVLPNQPATEGSDSGTIAPTLGPAKLELSGSAASGVDFGLVDCGSATSEKTIAIKNAGGEPLSWKVALEEGGNVFALTGPTNGTLSGGQTANITVRATVSATAHAGATSKASLRIDSNDASGKTTALPISITAAGAELNLASATVDFGLYPIGATAPEVPLTLANAGNKPVTVTFSQPSDTQFSVNWTGAPAPLSIAAGAKAAGLVGRFKPSTTSPSSAFAAMSFSGAVCGTSAQQIAMKGQGSNGVVGVTPAGLDFGQVDCGTTATPKKVTVSNTGNGAFTFDAKLDAAGSNNFTVSPAQGTVAPGGTTEVIVTPKAIPTTASVAANYFGGSLVITTGAVGDAPHNVALTETAHGAILTVSSASVNFASVPVSTTQTAGVTLTNSGNAPTGVTISASGTGFSVSPASGTIAASDALKATATFAPTASGAASGALAVAASNAVLCAPLPANVVLTGTGTSGSVALSAQSFDFGSTSCGSSASAKSLTLQNPGNASYTWSATLSANGSSPYTLSKASGTVSASGSDTLTITPSAVPPTSAVPGSYNDVLTVKTDVPGDAPHTITLSQSAQGAILKFVPTTAISFGQVGIGSSSTATFSLVNEGNLAANAVIASSDGTVALSPSSFSLAGGGSNSILATFKPTASGNISGTVSLSSTQTTGTMCAPLPSAISFSGEGTKGSATVSPAAVSFGENGYANCGTQASTQTVTVKNDGTASFNISSVSVPSGYSYATPGGTAVGVGKSVSVVVTPPAVPTTLAAVTSYSGKMTIKTDISGDVAHDVSLSLSSRGAILARTGTGSVAFSDTAWPGSSTQAVSFTNVGNSSATLNVSATANSGFTGPSSIAVATTGGSGTFTFTPSKSGAHEAKVSLSADTNTVLCSAVPSTFGLSGTGLAGVLTVSTTSIQFGSINCGASAGQQNLTVTNTGNATITNFYAGLGGSLFYQKGFYSVNAPGSLAAGASITAAVVVNSNEVGSSSDTSTIYGYAPISSVAVALSVKRTGAQITASPTSETLAMNRSHVASGSYVLTNSGDQAISVTVSVINASSGSYWSTAFSSTMKPDTTLAASGGSDTGLLNLYVPQTTTATATLSVAQASGGSIPICGTLPTIALTGTP